MEQKRKSSKKMRLQRPGARPRLARELDRWPETKGRRGRDLSKGDLGRLGGAAGVKNQRWKPGRERMNMEMRRERSKQGKGENEEERPEGVRTRRGRWGRRWRGAGRRQAATREGAEARRARMV